MRNHAALKREIDRLSKAVGVHPPVEQWGEREWQPIVDAFLAGADEVTMGGIRFTRAWFESFVQAWDEFRYTQAAWNCEEIAVLAQTRGFISLAAACRGQAAELRLKAGAQAVQATAGG